MRKIFRDPNQATLADLLADPIVQMVMKADQVTEHQLMELIGATLSKLAAESDTEPEGTPESARAAKDYRPSVGIMLLNRNNDVFVGRRRNTKGKAWQMPQGGIDEGEDPRTAAMRELKEETGVDNAEILAEAKNWLFYDLPATVINKARHGGWRGQRQKWFAMRFKGSDAEINIRTGDPEFSAWKWAPAEQLPDLIVPFKRSVYLSLLDEFRDVAEPLSGPAAPDTSKNST
jgi:putative (di)nucleoside polyphosphate hydrolase